MRTVVLVLALFVGACGDDDESTDVAPADAGSLPDAGDGCAHGELPSGDGCVAAGVPADACGLGFMADGDAGCTAIVPPTPCGVGEMAVVGETECHEVAPCPPEVYGNPPIEPDTQFVDASYSGGASDGSMGAPWTTIGDAVVAAKSGAVVAVAAGSYTGDVPILSKAVRIWGRCPGMAEIVGDVASAAVIVTGAGADGTELHDVAIRGPRHGIRVSGAKGVLLHRVWMHDTGERGCDIEDVFGATSVALTSSLVEHTTAVGIFVSGSTLTVDASVVRDTHPAPGEAASGTGVIVQYSPSSGRRADGRVTGSLLERNAFVGIFGSGADLTVEATLVRDTGEEAGRGGYSIDVKGLDGVQAKGVVRRCVLERSRENAVLVTGAELLLENTTIRNVTGSVMVPAGGYGVSLQANADGARSTATVRASFFDACAAIGIAVGGSDLTAESTRIRGAPQPTSAGTNHGIDIVGQDPISPRSTATLRGVVVENVQGVGAIVLGSDVTFESVAVRDVGTGIDGRNGIGIAIQVGPSGERSQADVTKTLVERVRESGALVVDSDVRLHEILVRDVAPLEIGGGFGDGIDIVAQTFPASAHIEGIRVERVTRAGIGAFGASVELANARLECCPIPLDGEVVDGKPFDFVNGAGNVCGCEGTAAKCVVSSSSVSAPTPLETR